MKYARSLLLGAAEKVGLPADVMAGVPRMELIGDCEFTLEPQKGLLEYEEQHIMVDSSIGKIHIYGVRLRIKLMNRERLTIVGAIRCVEVQGG